MRMFLDICAHAYVRWTGQGDFGGMDGVVCRCVRDRVIMHRFPGSSRIRAFVVRHGVR